MAALNFAEALDHFVVPVDDLVVAEEFYVHIFGGVITKKNGLNVRQRKRGAVPHTFIQIGGKRMGVYLQSEDRPQPPGVRGLPTYSFTTSARGLDDTAEDLNALGVRFDGPAKNAYPFADQTLFTTDPAGNHYAIYTQKNPPVAAGRGRITGVGYIELEAPNVNVSVEFYQMVLGFEVQSRTEDNRQATLKIASGQTLILTEAPFSPKGLTMSRKVPGPHIAFYIPGAKWGAALAHLDALKIPNGDRGAAKEPRHDGSGGTYMDDPAGYVIQYITDGME